MKMGAASDEAIVHLIIPYLFRNGVRKVFTDNNAGFKIILDSMCVITMSCARKEFIYNV